VKEALGPAVKVAIEVRACLKRETGEINLASFDEGAEIRRGIASSRGVLRERSGERMTGFAACEALELILPPAQSGMGHRVLKLRSQTPLYLLLNPQEIV
jgi:hypothetical protein